MATFFIILYVGAFLIGIISRAFGYGVFTPQFIIPIMSWIMIGLLIKSAIK